MRTTITLVAILLGLLVVAAVMFSQSGEHNRSPQQPTTQQSTTTQPTTTPSDQRTAQTDVEQSGGAQATPAASATQPGRATASSAPAATQPTSAPATTPSAAAPALGKLHLVPARNPQDATIGDDAKGSDYEMKVVLNHIGAAVKHITLSEYNQRADEDKPYTLMEPLKAGKYTTYPYVARRVNVNGQSLNLQVLEALSKDEFWSLTDHSKDHATYRLTIVDQNNVPILAIERTYRLGDKSYDINLQQCAINLTNQPLRVKWEQNIQGDLPLTPASYLGDRRQFVTGYFPSWDKQRFNISAADAFVRRTSLTGEDKPEIWPNPELDKGHQLAWVASENRYFVGITHAAVPADLKQTSQVPPLERQFPHVGVSILSANNTKNSKAQKAVVFTLGTDEMTVPASGSTDFDLGIYAGPRKVKSLSRRLMPRCSSMNWCVTRWAGLARCVLSSRWRGLLGFLKLIHAVLFDWGVAIILLVLVVRLLLHPITKRSQANMMKMSKQMQTLKPELEKIKKKYADDQQKINQETMKLYREKGVNPAGMLGCLPMFLQMPIWVALYAMLYFAIELRHEPAFYDVFFRIGELLHFHWYFLHDLSTSDNFVRFVPPGQTGYTLTWLPFVHPTFAGINILPILMAVVFYFQQKMTTPPAANDQAAQQQHIMRVMVLIFPVMLYSAPSGLTLYILASTAAGILDSYLVRKHVREQEEAGTLFQKKERKPGGLMDRLSKRMDAKQQELQKKMTQQSSSAKGKGKSRNKKSR